MFVQRTSSCHCLCTEINKTEQRPVAGALRPDWAVRRKSGCYSNGFAYLAAASKDR